MVRDTLYFLFQLEATIKVKPEITRRYYYKIKLISN